MHPPRLQNLPALLLRRGRRRQFLPASHRHAIPARFGPRGVRQRRFFVRAHNISIDSISGRLYTSGTNNFGSGTTVLDIGTNPEVPTLLGNYNLGTYTHDMYVRGDTLYMNNGGAGLAVYDFRNLSSPNPIGSLPVYPGQGYNHSSWLTDDGNYLGHVRRNLEQPRAHGECK
jgi:hypothetical protein